MVNNIVNFSVTDYSSRNELRSLVVKKFLEETPGTGTGELASNYRYNVETLSNGDRIYLKRPVPLNKGFDFVIHIENIVFSNNKDNPKHSDIIDDLNAKKRENIESFGNLIRLINLVGECHDPIEILNNETAPIFSTGLSIETLLKTIKWLFIEQDIRYWNWSGRNMFRLGLNFILDE